MSMGFSRQEYWSGCHALLQGNFPTQGSNWGLLHCRWILYQSSVLGPLCSSFCSFLQTQFPCLFALHPVIWPSWTSLPSHTPRAWALCLLFPCVSRARFLLWFSSILSQSVNKKKGKYSQIWEMILEQNHTVGSRKMLELSQAGDAGGLGVYSVYASLWLLDLLSLAFENLLLPELPWCGCDLRPTRSYASLGEVSSLLLPL